ncbi:multiubiquitin domain-containing protein [Brumimicrobium mesophilum]|uniref:multiubiquitin domain-containing protein n=1 Tax=Brumimicrobium mesophilum TaxID=392717 RepID=UPI000D143CEE|nr:multiubiquitin domain-containing protein [Brumimicrobium mesophilum]
MSSENNKKVDAPGQNKEYQIFVNGTPEEWTGKEISFEQVVKLAFPNASFESSKGYSVVYKKAENGKEGSLVFEDSVKVKSEMEFDVYPTNRS